MKFQYQLILILMFFVGLVNSPIKGQDVYLAGTATASIEPKFHPFSLALAGYGYPRGGRFSLEWIRTDVNFKSLISSSKQLQKWRKLAPNGIAFTKVKRTIYAVDQNGNINSAVVGGKSPLWKLHSKLEGVISLTNYKGRLLVLTANDEIFRYNLDNNNATWIKIAKFNGLTYDVHLKAITVVKDKLYGVDANNVVFEGQQRMDGTLAVSAVAISAGQETVVIVGADVCGFNQDFIAKVKQEIYKKHQILPSAILINASHTHFAPSTQDWTTWGTHQLPDSAYLNNVLKPALISVINSAMKNRKPSMLSFGRGKTAIGKNRSLEGAAATYDNDVDVLNIERNKDKQKTALFLTGCHPVFKNDGTEGFTLSANYPAVTRNLLKQEAVLDEAMFIQGCGGDINPVSSDYKQTGADLAADVKGVLKEPMQQLKGKISFYLDSINFAVNKWSDERILAFRKTNDNGKGNVEDEKNVRWADLMLKRSKTNTMPASMPVYIQTINIGNWKLIGLSREVVTDYSIGIKQLWPGKLVSVAGYSNDVSSYLPTSKHIKSGTYEGYGSFFWYGQPSVFPQDVYEKIISTIKSQNH
ncbi:hypothetical protein [Pedobacter xixiisoli]|uniref:Neutral/alkaline non-lysosomal ceramidase, N-terminal n=1 Tax=Pedobacter xixiisoli TaxID=1476464 RepID=A0A285ZZL5_9SPHI|nr:hypothetical protein [Pedobacter xixiisoli]SOD15087.1 hypothetical protein SAMN06297358_2061 [Pedobacter xixiisoli]